MKRMILIGLLVASCNHTEDLAENHLRAMGYKVVYCEGADLATCVADDQHFHCAVTNPNSGCTSDSKTACERFYVERPAP